MGVGIVLLLDDDESTSRVVEPRGVVVFVVVVVVALMPLVVGLLWLLVSTGLVNFVVLALDGFVMEEEEVRSGDRLVEVPDRAVPGWLFNGLVELGELFRLVDVCLKLLGPFVLCVIVLFLWLSCDVHTFELVVGLLFVVVVIVVVIAVFVLAFVGADNAGCSSVIRPLYSNVIRHKSFIISKTSCVQACFFLPKNNILFLPVVQ